MEICDLSTLLFRRNHQFTITDSQSLKRDVYQAKIQDLVNYTCKKYLPVCPLHYGVIFRLQIWVCNEEPQIDSLSSTCHTYLNMTILNRKGSCTELNQSILLNTLFLENVNCKNPGRWNIAGSAAIPSQNASPASSTACSTT